MENKYDVLLILEGTYPFNGGGVSTWSHMLCNEVKNTNFDLYSINAAFEVEPKYKLSESVKNVIQVPLWSPLEPQEMVNYGKKFHKIVKTKERSDDKDIVEKFIPIFEKLIKSIYQVSFVKIRAPLRPAPTLKLRRKRSAGTVNAVI